MIRPIAADDRDTWRTLFTEYGVFYETEFDTDQLDWVWQLLTTEASGVDALVAEQDGVVVGFAHYRSHPDTFSRGRDWFLDDLYVHPDARGAGHATALIEAITARAQASGPAGTLRWITAEDNTRAQRVYDRVATKTTWITYEKRL